MVLGIILLIGVCAVILWFLVALVGSALGFPMSTRAGREKRARIAAEIQQQQVQAEAARNLAVRDAEQRLAGEQPTA